MSLLSWWRGRKVKLTDGAFWSTWFGGESWSGESVSPDGALQLSTWWRATKLYADVTGTAPFKFYERKDNDERVQVRDHPVAEVIALSPNADQTTQEFWGGHASGLCIFGNAYAFKEVSGEKLIALTPLPPDTTQPYRTTDGELRYKFTDRGKSEDIPEDKVFHTRGFNPNGREDIGLSPLAYARQSLGLATAVSKAAGKTFSQGMRASGFFKAPGTLTEDQRKQVKKVLVDAYSGSGATAKAGVLEGGFDWVSANVNPHDAEMLLWGRHSIEDLCRWMGVPPILVGHSSEGQTMWGSGVENITLSWLTLGLDSFLSTIEKSVNKRLLSAPDRRRFYAEFDRNWLLRADSAGRAALQSSQAQNGIRTRNEIRARENLPKMPGGDILTVQSNLLPIEMLGQVQPRQMQPAPGDPIPEPAQ